MADSKPLHERRGRVINVVPLGAGGNYCGARGQSHHWRCLCVAHGVWIDDCEDCPTTQLVITERAEWRDPNESDRG